MGLRLEATPSALPLPLRLRSLSPEGLFGEASVLIHASDQNAGYGSQPVAPGASHFRALLPFAECPGQVRNRPGSGPLCSCSLSPTSCLAPSLVESASYISFGSVAKCTSYLSSASSNHHGQAE